jgi:uncharacterized membrane protein
MEALTDGIFAIAMTLLVLELKVPDLPKSVGPSQLLESVGHEAPAFFSFFVSFLYCGLLWVMHHLAMHFVRHLQIALVWLNLLFLMSISVMPFSCALLGHFLRNRVAQEIYFGNMFLAATLLAAQWLLARQKKLLSEDEPLKAQLMGQQIFFFPVALAQPCWLFISSIHRQVFTPWGLCWSDSVCGRESGIVVRLQSLLIPRTFLPDLNIEPLDLLVQRGKRNVEALGGVSLIPAALLQHVDDQTALAVFNNFKQ